MHIAVDGYNFIKQSPSLRALEKADLQKAREKLIELLAEYKRFKGHAITVVFDGAQEISRGIQKERQRGVEIIFSRSGEKADDVLKRMAAEKKKGIVIVTSDREIAHFAAKKGAASISIEDFNTRIEMARIFSIKAGGEEKESGYRPLAPQKKGPAHRLPKRKRRAELSFKKL
ncbi:MAG: NYN domain-containing protein [Thermodesulfobacteriota bacterium]